MSPGSHAAGVGIGDSRIPVSRTQLTGSVNCAKSTGRLAAGEPQDNFHPSENRPAHGSVAQWGKAAQQRIHAPDLAKVGHLGLGAAYCRDEGGANGNNIGVLKAGCPTFGSADRHGQWSGARY